jgi:integrase
MSKYQKTKYPGILTYHGKKGDIYVIDFYASGKRHREKVGPLLGEAQKKLANVKAKIEHEGYIPQSVKKKITLETIISAYRKNRTGNGYYERTEKYQLDMLESSLGKKRLCEITPQVIEDFRKQRQDTNTKHGVKRSDTTINRELAILRRLLNKAVLWGKLEVNPFVQFKNCEEPIFFKEKKILAYLKEDEIHRLLEVSPVYLQRIIKAAILTGLRKGDLLKMKWSDINLEGGQLIYYEQKKGEKIPKIKNLCQDMISLLMEIPSQSEYVFVGPNGQPLKDVKRSFHTALKKAGIKNFRFHDLRHTSASHLLMRGASLKTVQEHLGHANLTMTQRYAHIGEAFQKKELNRLNGIFDKVESSEKLVRNKETQKELENPAFATA